jgi:hypothetical protein
MSVEFEVVTSTGTYMKDGEEKKRWLKCGVIFKSEKGNYSMKLEAIPTKSSEDGMWFALFVPKPREDSQQQQGFRDKPSGDAPKRDADGFGDPDIPF